MSYLSLGFYASIVGWEGEDRKKNPSDGQQFLEMETMRTGYPIFGHRLNLPG
jgi:hypothetical protein